jgi:serine/threonine protein phosphatase PrpC
MLACTISSLWLPKRGNSLDEYEDAFAHQPAGKQVVHSRCCLAVADGASESSFANIWAKQLARQFSQQPFRTVDELRVQIQPLYERWRTIVFRKPLAWFAEEKARQGAFATLLGMEIIGGRRGTRVTGTWRSAAIGDSCLFQVRQGDLLLAWPVNDADRFDNFPTLLSSVPARNLTIWDEVNFYHGTWRKGDYFILATDALSACLLKNGHHSCPSWQQIIDLAFLPDAQEHFAEWVETRRDCREMKNDDTTCLVVVME